MYTHDKLQRLDSNWHIVGQSFLHQTHSYPGSSLQAIQHSPLSPECQLMIMYLCEKYEDCCRSFSQRSMSNLPFHKDVTATVLCKILHFSIKDFSTIKTFRLTTSRKRVHYSHTEHANLHSDTENFKCRHQYFTFCQHTAGSWVEKNWPYAFPCWMA